MSIQYFFIINIKWAGALHFWPMAVMIRVKALGRVD